MSENILASKTKSQLLSFFLQNPHRFFSFEEIRHQVGARNLKDDLVFMSKHGFILSHSKKSIRFYALNKQAFVEPKLKVELLKGSKKFQDVLTKEIKKMHGFELAVYSGFFKGYSKLQCDLLLVGTFSKKSLEKFESTVQKIIGDEINYAVFTKEEFDYRKDIFDRFIKDLFENDHAIVNKDKK